MPEPHRPCRSLGQKCREEKEGLVTSVTAAKLAPYIGTNYSHAIQRYLKHLADVHTRLMCFVRVRPDSNLILVPLNETVPIIQTVLRRIVVSSGRVQNDVGIGEALSDVTFVHKDVSSANRVFGQDVGVPELRMDNGGPRRHRLNGVKNERQDFPVDLDQP